MKDEEIKLPELPHQGFGETRSRGLSTKLYDEHTVRNLMREAVRLNQPQTEPLPFNLEAAKRGDPIVTRDGRDVRFIGVIENIPFGVAIHIKGHEATVSTNEEGRLCKNANRLDDLFMKPKLRTVWVTQKSDGTLTISDNELKQMCDAFNSECETYTSSVLIPDRR